MKTKSQIFDLRRFGLTLRREFMLHGRQLALNGAMMFGVLTIILIFIATLFTDDMEPSDSLDTFKLLEEIYTVLFLITGGLFCALGASMFANNVNSPGKRINELMSPSSHIEKYLSRFILCILCVPAAFVVSYALADGISLLVVKLCYGHSFKFILPVCDKLLGWKFLWSILAGTMTYMLGSTIWPKYSFVKTFLALMVLQFVMSMIAIATLTLVDLQKIDSPTGMWRVYPVFAIVWSAVCIAVSYIRMKKIEVK